MSNWERFERSAASALTKTAKNMETATQKAGKALDRMATIVMQTFDDDPVPDKKTPAENTGGGTSQGAVRERRHVEAVADDDWALQWALSASLADSKKAIVTSTKKVSVGRCQWRYPPTGVSVGRCQWQYPPTGAVIGGESA